MGTEDDASINFAAVRDNLRSRTPSTGTLHVEKDICEYLHLRKIKLAAPTKPACLPSCAGTTGTSR
jgi:Zn-dependent alcohol dehydrogenase